jgi:triosephosphate isomerase
MDGDILMRKAMVAGNWKMNGSQTAARSLIESIQQGAASLNAIDIAIFPAFIFLPLAQTLLQKSAVAYGGQNLYMGAQGAFTGEISGAMLADLGCEYVLVGHSERRQFFHDDLTQVSAKFKAALESGLKPILCIGETLTERETNITERILTEQLETVIVEAGIQSFQDAVIAYEPVWAIGTGLTATPEQAQAAHAFIRKLVAKHDVNIANAVRILYGGSVKADNAAGLFAKSDIDGALVGGASLDAKSFLAICQASLSASSTGDRVKN